MSLRTTSTSHDTQQSSKRFPAATITGYPRIGRNRELKGALEKFWAQKISYDELVKQAHNLTQSHYLRLQELGLDPHNSSLPTDFCYYDQVLSMMTTLGVFPSRWGKNPRIDLPFIFRVARGEGDRPALEMTKWFDSNYHYLVPEISPSSSISYASRHVVDNVKRAVEAGISPRPVLVGPLTFLLLSRKDEDACKDSPSFHPLDRLDDVIQVYSELLTDLYKAGAQWVQLDEPALVADTWDTPPQKLHELLEKTYRRFVQLPKRPRLCTAFTYGSSYDSAHILSQLGVEALILDLVRADTPDRDLLHVFAAHQTHISAGVVSGRNIWRTDLYRAYNILTYLREGISEGLPSSLSDLEKKSQATSLISVTTSTSLQHVPYDVDREEKIDPQIKSWLAFADQKVKECVILSRALASPSKEEWSEDICTAFDEDARIRQSRAQHKGVCRPRIREALSQIQPHDRQRHPYAKRHLAQQKALSLPLLPTTTIGSFPQTQEIRQARAHYRTGKIDRQAYTQAMKKEIAHVVSLQEELGLDVLVHGEAERNDMVQYFAEHLEGFVTTQHGWVQSYGSRCTRPSILWGDVSRPAPITVDWSTYAQSLTSRPMKGMLTGPVTILAWSFVRDDIPWKDIADQVALALRDEVVDLQNNGIKIIQVDEPAIRELLPLKAELRDQYLHDSVGAFLLATSAVNDETQIQTHLCYSDFNIVIEAIDYLDADVTLIEASRSKMEILPAIGQHGFERQIGPGIWDIHSPRVPSVTECCELLEAAVAGVGADKVWVNPDCGLKTRAYPETLASLKNLVEAAHKVRNKVAQKASHTENA